RPELLRAEREGRVRRRVDVRGHVCGLHRKGTGDAEERRALRRTADVGRAGRVGQVVRVGRATEDGGPRRRKLSRREFVQTTDRSLGFDGLNAKGEDAGESMYEGTYAVCSEEGPEALKSDAL